MTDRPTYQLTGEQKRSYGYYTSNKFLMNVQRPFLQTCPDQKTRIPDSAAVEIVFLMDLVFRECSLNIVFFLKML